MQIPLESMSSDESGYDSDYSDSDYSDDRSQKEEQYIMHVWDRQAWILYRSVFATVHDYLYAVNWSFFVAREASAQVAEVEPDTDAAQHRRALIHSGMCILEACIKDGAGGYEVSWDGPQGHKMKTGSSVWLSRTDPEIDAEKYTFRISAKEEAHMILAATHELPDDFSHMIWRVDLYRSSVVDAARLGAIRKFASGVRSPLRDLVVDDVLRQDAKTSELNLMVRQTEHSHEVVCREIARVKNKYALNDDQERSLWLSYQHRMVLIQGPPGTGKSRTATAQSDLHKALDARVLLCASTNQATHVLTMNLLDAELPTWKWLGVDAERELSDRQRAAFRPISITGVARQALIGRYDPEAKAFWGHVMDKSAELVASDVRIIVSTTNSSCTSKALNKLTYGMVLLDEAAQASEADVLQPLSLLERNGQVVQIGDHKQLPATVLSGRNKELGLDRSMFELLFDLSGHGKCHTA